MLTFHKHHENKAAEEGEKKTIGVSAGMYTRGQDRVGDTNTHSAGVHSGWLGLSRIL